MNQRELISTIASEADMKVCDARVFFHALVRVMLRTLHEGNDIRFPKVGKIMPEYIPPHTKYDTLAADGSTIDVPGRMKLYFHTYDNFHNMSEESRVESFDSDEELDEAY